MPGIYYHWDLLYSGNCPYDVWNFCCGSGDPMWSFPEEIKKGNVAVGSVMAGISTGIGMIIRAAVASPSGEAVQESLGSGILSTLYYYGLGLLFCVVGYVALTLFNRRYDLNKEIGNGNPAAGIMVAGMFVGLSIIISGVIL